MNINFLRPSFYDSIIYQPADQRPSRETPTPPILSQSLSNLDHQLGWRMIPNLIVKHLITTLEVYNSNTLNPYLVVSRQANQSCHGIGSTKFYRESDFSNLWLNESPKFMHTIVSTGFGMIRLCSKYTTCSSQTWFWARHRIIAPACRKSFIDSKTELFEELKKQQTEPKCGFK